MRQQVAGGLRPICIHRGTTQSSGHTRAGLGDVVQAFLTSLPGLEGSIRALEGVDQRASIASPIARWVRMNVGDACVILVEHAHRHLAQAERIRRAVGGSGGAADPAQRAAARSADANEII